MNVDDHWNESIVDVWKLNLIYVFVSFHYVNETSVELVDRRECIDQLHEISYRRMRRE